jgi:hypothetical protein
MSAAVINRSPLAGRIPEMTRNVLEVYRQATEQEHADGLSWYPRAHQIMIEWAEHYGYSIATAACVTAALSPQLQWERNLILADDVLAGRAASIGGVLRSNWGKAERVRDERIGSLLEVFPGGPKVNSFAANLAGDYSIVTVDAHAAQAALADVLFVKGLPWAPYACIAAAYRAAAKHAGIEPAHLQAVTWLVWKRLHPAAKKREVRRQW